MSFSSNIFLFCFLPLFLLLVNILPQKFSLYFILLCSLFFFSWGAPKFTGILLLSVVVDFFLARLMENDRMGSRKLFLWLGIILNLSLLFYFKYTVFFLENLNELFTNTSIAFQFHIKNIALPLGISFFTFQKISFLVDVYRKKKLSGSFLTYLNFILFFPKVLSGPILKWRESAQYLQPVVYAERSSRVEGFHRFSAGLFKKIWIADILGSYIHPVFGASVSEISSAQMWLAMMAYAFQIYFDFSGYTDMAIGIAKMAGFNLPENFNHPYLSKNIREFWQRWHITLTAWFKEYLFMPLAFGLSRKLTKNKYLNLKTEYLIYMYAVFITFLLTGFWHGAGWTFILWGAYHGFLLIADRIFLFRLLQKVPSAISTLVTFLLVLTGWVWFRAENMSQAFVIFNKMFSFTGAGPDFRPLFYVSFLMALAMIFWPVLRKAILPVFRMDVKLSMFKTTAYIILLIFSLSGVASQGFNAFIYFRF